jgi:hypothetical protein
MKRVTLLLLIGAAIASTLTGCKTTEENYRAAYEIAKQKNDENDGIEGTIYEKIRKEAISSRLIVDGDSIPMSTVSVSIAANTATPEQVLPYSIVINQFKLEFNARSQAERLDSQGYHGAFVLATAEPLYYVVAATYATPEEAAKGYAKIIKDKNLTLKSPFPWILKPARYPVK